jgi:hypothetical protein
MSFVRSVAKGPKFRPLNTKGAEKNCVENLGPNFWSFFKKGRKGAELFVVCFCTKTVIFLAENTQFFISHIIGRYTQFF